MSASFQVSTGELISILGKEISKTVPVLGNLVSAHDAVFAAIEKDRIRLVLEDFYRRIEGLERQSGTPFLGGNAFATILAYGCEQARHDPLVAGKVKEYGAVMASYAAKDAGLDEVVEILDSLRKLSSGDLKILYQFIIGDTFFPNRLVAELAGFQSSVFGFDRQKELRASMSTLYPNFMRLEGLGLLYLAHADSKGGMTMPHIGPLTDVLGKYAILTSVGERLVRALPR